MNRGNLFYLSDSKTESTFTCLSTTMAPYARWVLPSFKNTLLSACDEYMTTNDRGSDKARSKLITRVAKDITDIVEGNENEKVPDDLEKVGNVVTLHALRIAYHMSSVSAHGLATMHPAIPRRPWRKNPRLTRVAILPLSGHGRPSRFAVPCSWIVLPTSSLNCPTKAKRLLVDTAPR